MRWLTLALSAALLVNLAYACGKGKGKPPPDNGDKGEKPPPDDGGKQPPPSNDPLKDALGDNVKTEPLDNKGYDDKNGVANNPDDLKCDFEGPCCWKNSKPPYDTMDFLKASGSPDPDKFQKAFGTSTTPTGNFLVAATSDPAGPADKAELQSCAVACAADTIKVTFKHWSSKGAEFQVCEVAKSDPNTLLSCQPVSGSGPGPDTVELPPGSDLIISIIATKFEQAGAIALVDDITVDFPPCSSSGAPTTTVAGATPGPTGAPTPGPTPGPSGPGDVVKLCCDFGSGPCGWSKGSGPQSAKGKVNDFEPAGPEYFHNRATGVAPSPDKKCMAAYMKPGESAYMESAATFGDTYIIKFQEYKATEGLALKACCDSDAGCSYDTGGKVEKGDFRQWYQGSIQCPAGTQKVVFFSEDTGNNEGGVGIDNVEVYDAAGNNLCQAGGGK